MSTAPSPSTHIFLSQLQHHPLTTKVRFLACIIDYDTSTGHLLVEHNYPKSATSSNLNTHVLVDVTLVLESLKRETLQSGVWINVIGYVSRLPRTRWEHQQQQQRRSQTDQSWNDLRVVQAVLVWDAGALNVDEYEKAIEEVQALAKAG